jgi:hypothetical protein
MRSNADVVIESDDKKAPLFDTVPALAWMAKDAGVITYSWKGYGRASNMKKCICMLTTASARLRED